MVHGGGHTRPGSHSGRRSAERAGRTSEQLGAIARIPQSSDPLGPDLLDEALATLRGSGRPPERRLRRRAEVPARRARSTCCSARGERTITERTLDAMAAGGIYDQLGGGFARYSVDAVWLVPHFEKMLYDNALLARAYLHGYQELGHERYRDVCVETLDWALAEMRGPEGGFYSALDADSEGEEGRFYVWAHDEAREVLADAGLEGEAEAVLDWLGITPGGNFEGGRSVVHLPAGARSEPPAGIEAARAALLAAREPARPARPRRQAARPPGTR